MGGCHPPHEEGILHEERQVGSPAPSGVDDEAAPAVTSGKGGLRVIDVMVCNSKSGHFYTPVQTVDHSPTPSNNRS